MEVVDNRICPGQRLGAQRRPVHYGPWLDDRQGFPDAARTLRDNYHGRIENFLADLGSRLPMTKDHDATLLEYYCYAAAFSAEPAERRAEVAAPLACDLAVFAC